MNEYTFVARIFYPIYFSENFLKIRIIQASWFFTQQVTYCWLQTNA